MTELFGDETVDLLAQKIFMGVEPDDLIDEAVIADLILYDVRDLKNLALGDPGQWWSDLVSEVTYRLKEQLDGAEVPYRTS
jgi:hypothetical protein